VIGLVITTPNVSVATDLFRVRRAFRRRRPRSMGISASTFRTGHQLCVRRDAAVQPENGTFEAMEAGPLACTSHAAPCGALGRSARGRATGAQPAESCACVGRLSATPAECHNFLPGPRPANATPRVPDLERCSPGRRPMQRDNAVGRWMPGDCLEEPSRQALGVRNVCCTGEHVLRVRPPHSFVHEASC
jgi:hypothetical protein